MRIEYEKSQRNAIANTALDRDNEFDLHDQITLMKESNEKIADTLSKSRTMMSNILGISNEHDIESG